MFVKISGVLIILLLAAILGLQVYAMFPSLFAPVITPVGCQASIDAANKLVRQQHDIIGQLLDTYHADVYNNPNVTGAEQQLLMSAQYQVQALDILALQNEALLNIAAACK